MLEFNYRGMVTTIGYLESSANTTDEEESIGKISCIITHVYFVKTLGLC